MNGILNNRSWEVEGPSFSVLSHIHMLVLYNTYYKRYAQENVDIGSIHMSER